MILPALPSLRPYQAIGLRAVRAKAAELQRAKGKEAGYGILIVAPTGAGKTRCALEIATGAMQRGNPVLFVAAKEELIDQPIAKLAECGVPESSLHVIKAGRDEGNPDSLLTVASVQTLAARGMAPPAKVVIFDEARHFVAPDWFKVAGNYSGSVRIGLDATPARAGGEPIGDLFDAIVPISSVAELTELWHETAGEMGLVPHVIDAPKKAVKDLAHDPVERWLTTDAKGRRTIAFCQDRAHSKALAEQFRARGVPAEHVDATTDPETRAAALKRLASGKTLVLCNVLLFTEGLDVPELECVIIARGVGGVWTYLQMGGRALRPSNATGKRLARIIDLRGHLHRPGFGLLDEPRTWHLDGKPIRLAEALPTAVQCKSCWGWSRGGGVCPQCGATVPPAPPPKVSKREMREYAREMIPRVGPEWDYWLECVAEAAAKGWKPAAASMRFKARFGHWPKWGQDIAERALRGGMAA